MNQRSNLGPTTTEPAIMEETVEESIEQDWDSLEESNFDSAPSDESESSLSSHNSGELVSRSRVMDNRDKVEIYSNISNTPNQHQRKNIIPQLRRTKSLAPSEKKVKKTGFSSINEDVNNYIKNSQFSNPFQEFWAFVVFLSNTYNCLITFYFLSLPGTPTGMVLSFELITEFILFTDFFIRILMKLYMKSVWKKLWLLHEKNGAKWYKQAFKFLASFPQHFVLLSTQPSHSVLISLPIACLRALKLLRMYQIWDYFAKRILASKRKKLFSHIETVKIIYQLLLIANFMGAVWLIAYRVEPKDEETWHSASGMEDASNLEVFMNSVFFVVGSMTGLGYGDMVPLTNWERLVCLGIIITGSTIFADFFGRFAKMIFLSNEKSIENRRKLLHAKQFCVQRNLPSEFKNKIIIYYSFMRLVYGEEDRRYKILRNLPLTLRTELALHINTDLIQNVKLFQIADPAFIMAVTRELTPQLALKGDYIMRKGEIAEKMYFIKKGQVKVVCNDDESQYIAYLNEGSYFGEIGILMNNRQRTTSVLAETQCKFYIIGANKLRQILPRFPAQERFLNEVAKQRKLTTFVKDLQEIYLNRQLNSKNVMESSPSIDGLSQRFMNQEKRIESDEVHPSNFSSKTEEKKKVKFWLTKDYDYINTFIVIPGSKLYMWWTFVITFAIGWNMIYVPWSIAFKFHIWQVDLRVLLTILEIIALLIYFADIYYRAHVTHKSGDMFEINKETLLLEYMNTYFIFDFLSSFPFDYILLPFGFSQQVIAFLRLFRLLRIYRIFGIINDLNLLVNIQMQAFVLLILLVTYMYLSHLFCCIYYYIGRMEVGHNNRFDGQTLFEDIPSRAYLIDKTPILELTVFNRYIHFLYLGSCTLGAVIYGDIIPWTMSERLYTFLLMFAAKIFLSFTYAEASSLISTLNSSYTNYIRKKNRIKKWINLQVGGKLGKSLSKRVNIYQEILWNNFHGIDDQSIMKDLPDTLRIQASYYLFEKLVNSVDIFPTNDKGATSNIIRRLKLWVFPKGEFIIHEGELANEMYFILSGGVHIYTSEGLKLAELGEGKHFGEMALATGKASYRNASAYCASEVSVAILTLEDFNIIRKLYPSFQQKVERVIRRRNTVNVRNLRSRKKNIERKVSTKKLVEKSKEKTSATAETEGKELAKSKKKFKGEIKSKNSKDITIKPCTSITTRVIGASRLGQIMGKLSPEELREKISQTESSEKSFINKYLAPSCFCCNNLRKLTICIASFYSIIWVPLQFAFRLKYEGLYLLCEIIIICLFTIEIFRKILLYQSRIRIKRNQIIDESAISEDDVMRIRAETKKWKWKQIFRIVILVMVMLPFGLLFESFEIYNPTYFICFIKLFRIYNIKAVFWLFKILKKIHMNIFRLIEVFYIYYMGAHVLCCLFICLIYQKDFNDTWVKRIPYPYPDLNGYRTGNDRGNVTDSDIYNHAIYFAVNTISNIAIGDVTPVSVAERLFVGFFVLTGTFIYAFLFANIASLVTDISQGLFQDFQKKYKKIMTKIELPYTPLNLVSKTKGYLEYDWAANKGIDDRFLSQLPNTLVSDIQLGRFHYFVHNCFLFEPDKCQQERVGTSLLRLLEFRTYLQHSYIVKAGSLPTHMYFLLDGAAFMVGLDETKIGIVSIGGFYSDILEENPIKRSLIHLIACENCIVGVLSRTNLEVFLNAFPNIAQKINFANECIYDKGLISFENYLQKKKYNNDLETCRETLETYYIQATNDDYQNKIELLYENEELEEELDLFKNIRMGHQMNMEYQNPSSNENIVHDDAHNIQEKQKRLEMRKLFFQSSVLFTKKTKTNQNLNGANQRCYIAPHSTSILCFHVLHLTTILYSCFAIPLSIAFNLDMSDGLLAMEIASLVECGWFIILNFRIMSMTKEGMSNKCSAIFKIYKEKGLLIDVMGVLPFNLYFGVTGSGLPLYTDVPLRLLRCLLLITMPRSLSEFDMVFRGIENWLKLLKVFVFFFILWNAISCAWWWLNDEFEAEDKTTWIRYHGLDNSSFYIQFLMAVYYVLNIVTGVGYGDMFPLTNNERLFTCLMINTGDALFAVIFGMVAALAITSSPVIDQFFKKMSQVTDFILKFNIEQIQRKRIEEYFGYVWTSKQKPNPSINQFLKENLPYSLAKQLVLNFNKDLIKPLFLSCNSENFLEKIALSLKTKYFQPGDYIILQDKLIEKMYFIADGVVALLSHDKAHVLSRLGKGEFFGDFAIILGSKSHANYVAETYVTLYRLKKSELQEIFEHFPSCGKTLKEEALRKMMQVVTLYKDHDRRDTIILPGISPFKRTSNQKKESPIFNFNKDISALSNLRHKKSQEASKLSESIKQKITQLPKQSPTSNLRALHTEQLRSSILQSSRASISKESINSDSEESEELNDLLEHKIIVEDDDEQEGARLMPNTWVKGNRRFSRLTLGKQLTNAETAGLDLQWTITVSKKNQ